MPGRTLDVLGVQPVGVGQGTAGDVAGRRDPDPERTGVRDLLRHSQEVPLEDEPL
ncbi:hypothetical protein ACFV0T_29310 [Streptomyces sp. NPDC059582]|uniref:hypothetical protein n=1 Tax=Streptomyces sp. NPDC059582 TaxID=3346875 RepID=UPI0036A5EFEF